MPRIEFTSLLLYNPQSGRMTTRRAVKYISLMLEKWRANLDYPITEITRNTLNNTTQLIKTVETETRESMRDHLCARLIPLRPHRINNTCFTDTFFSTQRSYRGFKYWQLYTLQKY